MQYKTITLELIRNEPALYEDLRSTKRLLPAMDAYAIDLKSRHEAWTEAIALKRPGSDPSQVAAEALEMAIQELQDRLHCVSQKAEAELISIDDAMSFIRSHTPPA